MQDQGVDADQRLWAPCCCHWRWSWEKESMALQPGTGCFLNTSVLNLTAWIQGEWFVVLTWYLASSLLFQREWAMSWMDRRRLWVLPLKCKALGSSKSCPPICRSSWRTSCRIVRTRRKRSGFIETAHWSSESSRLTAVDAGTCIIQRKKMQRYCTELWTGIGLVDLSISSLPPSYSSSPAGLQAAVSPLGDTVLSNTSYKQKA